jgi:hypothetical protein
MEVGMQRLLLSAAVALFALAGCQKKAPPAPTPTTRALQAVAAATPASDPSLPSQADIAATSPSDRPATGSVR